MGKDYKPMDLSDLDEIRERLLSNPSYNDIEYVTRIGRKRESLWARNLRL